MLPTARDNRVSVIHQKGVADVGCLVTRPAFVEIAVYDAVPPVVDFVREGAIAPDDVHGVEDVYVEAVFDEAGGIPRRLVEIDNLGVQSGLWIDHGTGPAYQDFVRADRSKRLSAECGPAAGDLELCHPRRGSCGGRCAVATDLSLDRVAWR